LLRFNQLVLSADVMVGMYIISRRRCGLAYCALHAEKQGWQLLTTRKVPNFGWTAVANASPRVLSQMRFLNTMFYDCVSLKGSHG